MGLRLKGGLHPDVLREYGFKTGKEWAEAGERCMDDLGYKYMHGWYHKFAMNPEDSEHILYVDDEYDEPMTQITFNPVPEGENIQWVMCTGGDDESEMIADTVYQLTHAGLLERGVRR